MLYHSKSVKSVLKSTYTALKFHQQLVSGLTTYTSEVQNKCIKIESVYVYFKYFLLLFEKKKHQFGKSTSWLHTSAFEHKQIRSESLHTSSILL